MLAEPPDLHRDRVHVDARDVVDNRDDQRTTAHDHPLAAEAGSDEGLVF
ncbi:MULTISPECIES: hypothetical protein [Mesorhizobium]|uniref:Uncharacterized protein n=1 Tax=Mesorhizobium calcicola TaxID=1300310 RepID=A0ABW4WPV7_9HYPH|nr:MULTISPECIES: hypothetical protein [Mesorhizobium]